MQAIQGANPDGVLSKNKRQVTLMNYNVSINKIINVNNTLISLSLWNHKNISHQITDTFGDVSITELDNIRIILKKYKNHLSNQNLMNLFRNTKSSGTEPTLSNFYFTFNQGVLTCPKKQKQTD